MQNKIKVIVVVGPTGAGKSALAFRLAHKYHGYLISADSRQVYQGMDIGTNKDLGKRKKKHGQEVFMIDDLEEYLVDFLAPDADFTLYDWLKAVKALIKNKSDQLPIVVGGTTLYTTALTQGYRLDGGRDQVLRHQLEQQYENEGLESLVDQLLLCRPSAGDKIDLKNPRRVIRAIEQCLLGRPTSILSQQPSEFKFLQLGITLPRDQLYVKINNRVEQMIKEGLVEEVKKLVKKGYGSATSMTGIGYRQIIRYLNHEITLDEAIDLIRRDTRHYAKRQLTWYKKQPDIHWVENTVEADRLVKEFLNRK